MAVETEFDPFIGSSGLADDVDVTFKNFVFGVNPQYVDNDGNMPIVAMVDMVFDDPEFEPRENQILTIGKGWVAEDKGKKVVREDGKPKGFNNATYLQIILDKAMDLDEEKMRGRYEETGLTPQEAGYWEGARFHMEIEEREFTIQGEKRTTSRLVPTAVLGWASGNGSGSGSAKPATKKPAAKKVAAAKKEAVAAVEKTAVEEMVPHGGLDGVIAAKIRLIADTSDTYEEFVNRAYGEVDGADEDQTIQDAIEDDSDSGIWAAAVAAAE